jgi:imidazolonepropionase-like amidohydrolase
MNRRFVLAAAAVGACLALPGPAGATEPQSPPIAIEHVTVVTMDDAQRVLRDQTVVVSGGRIAAVTPSAQATVPTGARRIDGRGRWLTPALADAHVHVANDRLLRLFTRNPAIPDGAIRPADAMAPYVAHGVLQIVNMGAMSEAVGLRSDIESGRVLGPHTALGAMIDGEPPIWPEGFARVATSEAGARQAVRDAQAEGYDFIKIYSKVTPAVFTAIAEEAKARGLKVAAHMPRTGADAAWTIPAGVSLIAHAEELAYQSPTRSEEDARRFAHAAKRNGAWLVPTLTLNQRIMEQARDPETINANPALRYLDPYSRGFWTQMNPYRGRKELAEEMVSVIAFNRRLVRAFREAGVPVLAGSDAMVPGVAPGAALHDELEALREAGLTNAEALAAATRLPAQWLGVYQDRGSVEVGKRADLLLLDADPLADISATRMISAVIASGRYLPRDELDAMMAEMADRFGR